MMLVCRRTGMLRPTSGPTGGKRGTPLGARHKRKPPRGMYINHDDLAAMASGNTGVVMLKAMDRELDSLQRQVSTYPFRPPVPLRDSDCLMYICA